VGIFVFLNILFLFTLKQQGVESNCIFFISGWIWYRNLFYKNGILYDTWLFTINNYFDWCYSSGVCDPGQGFNLPPLPSDSRMTSQRTGLDSGGMISKLFCRKKKKKTKRKTYLVSKHTFVSLHPLFNWLTCHPTVRPSIKLASIPTLLCRCTCLIIVIVCRSYIEIHTTIFTF
jgi:hypothetical protein